VAVTDGMLASGTEILIRAFIEEFAAGEDVSLVLQCPPKSSSDGYIDFEAEVIAFIETELGQNLEDIPSMTLLVGSLPEHDRAKFFTASHAFVQPARAEATGRHCLEALACQTPVIATDWGPLADFLNEQNSFRVTTNGLAAAQPKEDELLAGHRWADPNIDHLRRQMREVFENPSEAARRAEQGRHDVISRFDWNVVLPEWVRNFRRLLA